MSEYLNKDMNEAINSIEISNADKEVLQQILMLEKREKNNAAAKNEIVNAGITLVERHYANHSTNNLEEQI